MVNANEAYKKKVWAYLDKLHPVHHIVIDDICERENYMVFVACIKEWMNDRLYNGGIEFNKTETAFDVKYVPIKSVVFVLLMNMQPGTRYRLVDLCHKDHTEPFIACVKAWMDNMPWQGGLSFNATYSEFYITHIPNVIANEINSTIKLQEAKLSGDSLSNNR